MDFDIKPSEWLRHRIHEVLIEQGDKFDLASWLEKAYHDRKLEQLRARKGFAHVGRPTAHAMKKDEPVKSASWSLKRKDLHVTPQSTPSKNKASPGPAAESTAGLVAPGPKPKKIKLVTGRRQTGSEPSPPASTQHKKPRIVLVRPAPRSSAPAQDDALEASLTDDGYTSTDRKLSLARQAHLEFPFIYSFL